MAEQDIQASPSHALKGHRSAPISSATSFISMVLLLPWAWSLFMIAWGNKHYLDRFSERGATIILWGFASLPAVAAIAFGFHSIKIDGLALRNLPGIIGFTLGTTTIIAVVGFLWIVVGRG